MAIQTRPFRVEWDEADLDRLRDRVRHLARALPPAPDGAGWRYGCDADFLREFCTYWADGYDARAAVVELNRFPQIVARIEDLDVHAVHVVGEAEGRRPLLMTHGWPGSPYEFWRVVEPLAFPSRHGGRAEDAFDLVIPSLPGFGFSGKPDRPVGARTTARLFDTLMRKALGYRTYRAQGGDWGAGVGAWIALDHRRSLEALHLNYLLVQPAKAPRTREEKAWRAAFEERERELGAYARLQSTRPQSLAYAMADDPVAQAAWLLERFHDWADLRHRPFEEVFTRDQLLTGVMVYVMNDAFTSSTWFYAGGREEGVRAMPPLRRVRAPTAFAAYPDPRTVTPPESWVKRGYDLRRWADMPRGGHFAAMEVPELFVQDLREWARG